MKNVLEKTFHGLFFGIMGSLGLYAVFFFIELFSFIKELLNNSNSSELAGTDSVLGYTFENYTPLMSVWNMMTVVVLAGGICALGTIVGLVMGCMSRAELIQKVNTYNTNVIEDGSKRQEILFAKEIKTMAQSLTSGCDENLFYMKNIVETEYITGTEDEAIMTELVKFIGYEQALKDHIVSGREGSE